MSSIANTNDELPTHLTAIGRRNVGKQQCGRRRQPAAALAVGLLVGQEQRLHRACWATRAEATSCYGVGTVFLLGADAQVVPIGGVGADVNGGRAV